MLNNHIPSRLARPPKTRNYFHFPFTGNQNQSSTSTFVFVGLICVILYDLHTACGFGNLYLKYESCVFWVDFVVNLDAATFQWSCHIHIRDEFYLTDTLCVVGFLFRTFPLLSSSSSTFLCVQVCSTSVCRCAAKFHGKNRQSFLMYKLLTRTPMRTSYSHGAFVFLFHVILFFACLFLTLFSLVFTFSTIAATVLQPWLL